jgi:hypothetical protein
MDSASRAELIDEASKWNVGLGTLVLALAPLALPLIALTLVALIPLAIPAIALGLVAALIAIPVLLVRGLVRRAIGGVRSVSHSRGAAEAQS